MARISLGICLMLVVASSVIYEAQGTFLLKHYLRKSFPRKCNEFTPFANKGMMMLVTNLEGTCPKTTEFKNFFTQFKSYMTFINSASTSSKNIDTEMNTKCEGLFKAMSALTGAKGGKSADAGGLKATMLSMGKTLIQQKKNTAIMNLKQKKELVISMVKWTKMLATFVKSASENKGKKIDIASYGLDVDANDSSIVGTTETSASSTKTETKTGASGSASGSYKTKESSGGSSGKSFKDTTGKTSGSPSGSPMASPSSGKTNDKASTKGSDKASTKGNDKTSIKGSASVSGGASAAQGSSGEKTFTTNTATNSKTSSERQSKMTSESSRNSSSTTTVKQVESQSSKEVMSFIMELEKKYSSKTELKAFFEKLKASMQVSSNIASKTAKDYVSATRAASTKLSEAMALVSSRNVKSAKMKSNIETCQADVMKTLKQLQDINSKIVSGKTVTSTQQTELKQTITKWEQVTTKFVETAASSSSSTYASSSQQKQEGNEQMVKKN